MVMPVELAARLEEFGVTRTGVTAATCTAGAKLGRPSTLTDAAKASPVRVLKVQSPSASSLRLLTLPVTPFPKATVSLAGSESKPNPWMVRLVAVAGRLTLRHGGSTVATYAAGLRTASSRHCW